MKPHEGRAETDNHLPFPAWKQITKPETKH